NSSSRPPTQLIRPVFAQACFRYPLRHESIGREARVVCSNCGTENRPGRAFCVECGTALASACPSCGAEVGPGEKFCGSCGTRLTTAAAPTATTDGSPGASANEPIAERRLVPVLFADLVGFTTL